MRLWLLAAAAAGLVLVTAVAAYAFLLGGDDANLATTAPDLPTVVQSAADTPAPSSPASAATNIAGSATESPTEPSPTPPHPVSRFVIDPAQSTSTFVVETNVLGVSSSAVATGSGVTGQIHVSPAGLDTASVSAFQLDMRSLTSASGLLRRFLASGAFDTDSFPHADFVAAASSPFPPEYGSGSQFSFELSGTLTLNGVSRPVTLHVLARQSGGFFSATADTYIELSQFNVEVPDTPLGGAEDTVHVQVVMVASLA
jgi:polyisoprenoid-binding protein YceI